MFFRIKEAREKNGMTQSALAEQLGVNSVTLSGYETGKHDPKSDTLVKIAQICGVTVDFLLGREESETKPSGIALTTEAQEIAEAFMKADAITKELVWSVINIEKKRSLGLPESMKQVGTFRGVPMFDAKLDGTAEMKYAARKEQQEIEKEEVTT